MKKLIYLSFSIVLLAAMNSCSKEMDEEIENSNLKKTVITEITESAPLSNMSVTPFLIPGANKGGNRTCDEVAMAFDTQFAMCGEKTDYEEGNFMGMFPEGLNVVTDGIYISFSIDGCLEIDGNNYKVGAVIVKGSDQANIYYYPDGVNSDSHLAPPVNSSGTPAGLSNLTFCFVECEPGDETYIFMKLFYYGEDGTLYWSLIDSSEPYYQNENDWCYEMGINKLNGDQLINLIQYGESPSIGSIHLLIEDNKLMTTISLDEGLTPFKTYVFVGTLEELEFYGDCPDYRNFPYYYTGEDVLTFEIPLE